MKVTFIGLGIMGSAMAANLLKRNVALTVFNRSAEPMRDLEAAGAEPAPSARDAVNSADIVFTMLSNPEVVHDVALSQSGFLSGMKENAVWVDCSTVNPSFSLRAAEAAAAMRIRFVDAPVAGTKPHAQRGELVFLVGGDRPTVEEITPLLNYMGSRVVHVGENGRGAAYKMLVNALLAQSMLAFCETLLLGEKLGLSRDFLLDTLPKMPVAAPFLQAKAEMIRNGTYEAQFPLEWMHKDLHLAATTAYEQNQPLFLANLAKEMFADACRSGLGREDFAAVYRHLKNR